MKNLKEYVLKNWHGLAIGLYIGLIIGFLIATGLTKNKKDDIRISTLYNFSSSELICLDDIAQVYLSTGMIMSNPKNREWFKRILSKNEEYVPRPFREYTEGITPELSKKRMGQLLAFAAGVK